MCVVDRLTLLTRQSLFVCLTDAWLLAWCDDVRGGRLWWCAGGQFVFQGVHMLFTATQDQPWADTEVGTEGGTEGGAQEAAIGSCCPAGRGGGGGQPTVGSLPAACLG